MNLDITEGTIVSMEDYDCVVRFINHNGAFLEYPSGEVKFETFQDISRWNEDLVLNPDENCNPVQTWM